MTALGGDPVTALRGDPEQIMAALKHANDIRTGIAEFKRTTKKNLTRREAIVRVIDVIEHRHDEVTLGAARVRDLLESIPGMGEVKSRKLLAVADAGRKERLRDLTPRQRGVLVRWLELYAWRAR